MTFKEKVQKVLLELEEGKDYKDIKENIVKSIKVDLNRVQKDADDKMEIYFKNITNNIKVVIKEVIEENPELIKNEETS